MDNTRHSMYSGKGYWTRMFIVAYDSVCGHEEGLASKKVMAVSMLLVDLHSPHQRAEIEKARVAKSVHLTM